MITLALASNNQGKLREIAALLSPLGLVVKTAAQLGFTDEVEETGATFADNARLKACAVARALNLPALADDSGLAVEALHGAPGVHSARYAGLGAGDADRNAKLLAAMKDIPPESRGAAFICCMACCRADGQVILSEGRLQGRIAPEPRGDQGFGYDPVFELPEQGRTVAMLTQEEKNALSHRGRALRALAPKLRAFLQG